ncbi:MAG: S9 family peptidase [Acidobacteriota bacterium]
MSEPSDLRPSSSAGAALRPSVGSHARLRRGSIASGRSRAALVMVLGLTVLGLLWTLALPTTAAADEEAEGAAEKSTVEIAVDQWWVLDPQPAPLPAFSSSAAAEPAEDSEKAPELGSLLDFPTQDPDGLRPTTAGAEADAPAWTAAAAPPATDSPARTWLAAYIEADRFAEATLSLTSAQPFVAYWDGEAVAERKSAASAPKGEEDDEVKAVTADLSLLQGKGLLLVETVYDPSGGSPWAVEAKLEVEEALGERVRVSLDAQRGLSLADLLDIESVLGVGISASGDWLSLRVRDHGAPKEDAITRTEIRSATDGEVARVHHGSESSVRWAPEGDRYAYTVSGEAGTDVWIASVGGGTQRVLEGVEDFSFLDWLPPAGAALIYGRSETPEADSRGVKLLRSPNDRWPSYRAVTSLYRFDLESGSHQRLTAGEDSVSYHDARPDGEALLISIGSYQDDVYPFNYETLYELDLATLSPRQIAEGTWVNSAIYAPDGSFAVVSGAPTAFGSKGSTLGEGELTNLYDTQLYRLDLADLEIQPLSRELDPAVEGMVGWSGAGELIFRAQVGPRSQLFAWRPTVGANGGFTQLEWDLEQGSLDNVGSAAVAADGSRVVISGEGAATPARVLTAQLSDGRLVGSPQELLVPLEARGEELRLGTVKNWSYETEAGDTLDAHVTYPPDFDPGQKYPLLVYYYSGTVPSTIDFGGRYPKDLWASMGYVVLVVQPSGATGYGQEFSARHLNNWGRTVAGEIIEGTERFIAEHPFVDGDRVGCLGASYGGFMTMYLLTQTDLFSAAVAHAGISSLSSYWGEGYWGWLYKAVASAESYPWDAPDLYVDQSPLFSADKINTPLLLTHGDADTNVPVGESEQLYVALRILGREVEFLEVDGQDHRIVPYDQKKLWTQAIIAWFDRYLKEELGYWEHLFGTAEEPKG